MREIGECRPLLSMVALLVLLSTSASAHDVWMTAAVDESGRIQVLVHHGHPGDRKRPDPDKLFDVILHDGRTREPFPTEFQPVIQDGLPILRSEPLTLDRRAGLWLVGGQYDNGYWVKTPQGYRNTSKVRVPQAEVSLSSLKSAKMLLALNKESSALYSDHYKEPLGHPLELIPLTDPFLLTPGAMWPVRVLLYGRPLVGIPVDATDGVTPPVDDAVPRYTTNHEGVAHIPIPHAGPLLLVVEYEEPGRHPDEAAVDRYHATFHVTLPGS